MKILIAGLGAPIDARAQAPAPYPLGRDLPSYQAPATADAPPAEPGDEHRHRARPHAQPARIGAGRVHPLLDQAALDAVQQWEYTPTLLNGVPVPVVVTVTITFTP